MLPDHYPRKKIRSMGRVAKLAVVASERALDNAGLLGADVVSNGDCGIAYGSSSGSPDAIGDFGAMLAEKSTRMINSTSYIRMMSHTAAVNTSLFFNIRGRLMATSTACTSGSQAIGYAYEAVKHGAQRVMVAGGAEELSATQAAVFDTLFATSVKNDAPSTTPRPWDRDRDGLVIGEGAATLILEDWGSAVARGARIFAELVGFGTNCDAQHVTQPTSETMEQAMHRALRDVGPRRGRDRLRERPRHGHGARRHRGESRDARRVRRAHPDQLHEELFRPHARSMRRAGGLARDRDDEPRPLRADAESATTSIRAARASTTSSARRGRSVPSTS